jgi:lipoprotein-releasing system permease protein
MNFERFIAQKILRSGSVKNTFQNPLLRTAVLSIALGMAVMVLSILVVTGFRKQISDKVIGFGAHIQISNFDNNHSYEESPMSANPEFLALLKNDEDINSIQPYASKAGIIKTDEEIEGVILKGVSADYNWGFFNQKLLKGKIPDFDNHGSAKEALISSSMANRLNLDVGSDVVVYFIEHPPRIRKFIISGIYNTGLDEFDRLYAFCDIKVIRKLNSWNDTLVGGFELTVKNPNNLDRISDKVYKIAGYRYNTMSIKELYPQIFNWLDLQDINVYIILGLLLLVSGVSMISILLIIILDNVNTIGILKSLGASNKSVKNIFIRVAVPVIFYGMVIGNVIGIGMGMAQAVFGFIKLPVESYYVSEVPIHFSIPLIVVLNIGTLVSCFIMLIWPASVVARIRPARVLKYD